jgi:hypothetical protein
VVFKNHNVLQTDQEMDIEGVDGEAVDGGTKGHSGSTVPVPVSEVGEISEKIEVKGKGGKYKKIVREVNPTAGEPVHNTFLGKKHYLTDGEEENLKKKGKTHGETTEVMTTPPTPISAGLSVQPRREQ